MNLRQGRIPPDVAFLAGEQGVAFRTVEPLEEGGGQFRARPVVHDPAMLQGDGSGAEGQRVVDLMQGHEHGEPVLLVPVSYTHLKAFFASDYAGIIEGMRFKKVDLCWIGNKGAIQMVDRSDGSVFAQTTAADGTDGYYSLLVVNKESPLKSVDDVLKNAAGLRFSNGDPNSTSGFLVPGYYAVSYTHLDVYKRQAYITPLGINDWRLVTIVPDAVTEDICDPINRGALSFSIKLFLAFVMSAMLISFIIFRTRREVEGVNQERDSMADISPGGIVKCTRDDFRMLYINQGCLELAGYSREELEDRFQNVFLGVVYPEDRARLTALMRELSLIHI